MMTDKQQKANIVCCETCSHREVCYDVITNTDYDFKGYGCLRYCVSPLVISNNARQETAKDFVFKVESYLGYNADNETFTKKELLLILAEVAREQYGVEVEE